MAVPRLETAAMLKPHDQLAASQTQPRLGRRTEGSSASRRVSAVIRERGIHAEDFGSEGEQKIHRACM
jgi:hypothetical protein